MDIHLTFKQQTWYIWKRNALWYMRKFVCFKDGFTNTSFQIDNVFRLIVRWMSHLKWGQKKGTWGWRNDLHPCLLCLSRWSILCAFCVLCEWHFGKNSLTREFKTANPTWIFILVNCLSESKIMSDDIFAIESETTSVASWACEYCELGQDYPSCFLKPIIPANSTELHLCFV